LSFAIFHVCEILEAPDSNAELRLRASNALAQVATVYANLLKQSDFEARLTALEGKVAEAVRPGRNGHH
jgi:hypothetical protein